MDGVVGEDFLAREGGLDAVARVAGFDGIAGVIEGNVGDPVGSFDLDVAGFVGIVLELLHDDGAEVGGEDALPPRRLEFFGEGFGGLLVFDFELARGRRQARSIAPVRVPAGLLSRWIVPLVVPSASSLSGARLAASSSGPGARL